MNRHDIGIKIGTSRVLVRDFTKARLDFDIAEKRDIFTLSNPSGDTEISVPWDSDTSREIKYALKSILQLPSSL